MRDLVRHAARAHIFFGAFPHQGGGGDHKGLPFKVKGVDVFKLRGLLFTPKARNSNDTAGAASLSYRGLLRYFHRRGDDDDASKNNASLCAAYTPSFFTVASKMETGTTQGAFRVSPLRHRDTHAERQPLFSRPGGVRQTGPLRAFLS